MKIDMNDYRAMGREARCALDAWVEAEGLLDLGVTAVDFDRPDSALVTHYVKGRDGKYDVVGDEARQTTERIAITSRPHLR